MKIQRLNEPDALYGLPKTLDRSTSDLMADPWSSGTAYVVGALCFVGVTIYRSIQNGTNKPPATEPTYWEVFAVAESDGDFDIGSPSKGESRRQINLDGTVTDFVLGIDYPLNPTTMDVVNGTGVAVPAGAWAGTPVTYVKGQMVSSNGTVYIAKIPVPVDIQPGVTEGWETYWGVTTWATNAAAYPTAVGRTWTSAILACAGLTWNGSSDWRLPTVQMILAMLPNFAGGTVWGANPCVNKRLFPGLPASGNYWTNTRNPSACTGYACCYDSQYAQITRIAMTIATYLAFPVRPTKHVRETIVLNDPYEGVTWGGLTPDTHAKAALHVHTTASNLTAPGHIPAEVTPTAQIDAYQAAGYKILSLTDHDQVEAHPWETLHDRNELWENRVPGDIGMVAIEGNENLNNNGGHDVIMFSNYNTAGSPGGVMLGALADGGFVRTAHPTWSTPVVIWTKLGMCLYPYNADYDLGWHGMEIVNSKALDWDDGGGVKDPSIGGNKRWGADLALWDKFLTYLMPFKSLWGYCVDDSHAIGPWAGEMAGAAYTVILVDELTDAKVRAAMVAGQMYGVSGGTPPILTSIVHNETAKTITITASNWTEIEWISEGVVIANGSILYYGELVTIKSYVRAHVKNATGDLWLQPIAMNMLH